MHACLQEYTVLYTCIFSYVLVQLYVLYVVPDLSGTPESPTVTQTTTESKHMHCCVH